MCFRPAGVSKPIECPNCKKKLPAIGGVRQKKCPFCKTEIPAEDAVTDIKSDDAGTDIK